MNAGSWLAPPRRTLDDLLDELTLVEPARARGRFRHWLRGSLSLVHLHVLTVLEDDGPLPMSKLADALDVSVASATGIVDRMEQRGLVERTREPDDRRVILVHATEAGDAVFRRSRGRASQDAVPPARPDDR